VDVITTGIVYDREAREKKRSLPSKGLSHAVGPEGAREVLLNLLSSFNVSDKSTVYQHYDSEVQGRAVIRPGEADAAVAVLVPGNVVGLATSCGGNSRLAAADPYLGGVWSVCEAVRNVVCVGARPLAITDCLNFGDPEDPAVFHDFSEAVRGIGDACRALEIEAGSGWGVPVVSGNVSFYNQSETGDAIAPTPIVSCAGRLDDVTAAGGMGLKRSGSVMFFLGVLHDRMGGSEYERFYGSADPFNVPQPDFECEVAGARAVLEGFAGGVLLSAHDVSQGGLAVTAAEMILASEPFRRGCELDLTEALKDRGSAIAPLFSEYGGYLLEVASDRMDEFQEILQRCGAPGFAIGTTTEDGGLAIKTSGGRFEATFTRLKTAFEGRVGRLLG
jgi:phosphoribosylformylglycinamidine synthase